MTITAQESIKAHKLDSVSVNWQEINGGEKGTGHQTSIYCTLNPINSICHGNGFTDFPASISPRAVVFSLEL